MSEQAHEEEHEEQSEAKAKRKSSAAKSSAEGNWAKTRLKTDFLSAATKGSKRVKAHKA